VSAAMYLNSSVQLAFTSGGNRKKKGSMKHILLILIRIALL
jgi:hypothetical protein